MNVSQACNNLYNDSVLISGSTDKSIPSGTPTSCG